MGDAHQAALVVDCGSLWCRAGLAGEDGPRAVFPCVAGRKHHKGVAVYDNEFTTCRTSARGLTHPVRRGVVTDWDGWEEVMHQTFTRQLQILPEGRSVLVSEAPLSPRNHRQRAAQILFEKFAVGRACVKVQSVLALYATGRTTGVVLESGDGLTSLFPIFEGYVLDAGAMKLEMAGSDLTRHLAALLVEQQGVFLRSQAELEIVRDLKEKECYVTDDYFRDLRGCSRSTNDGRHYQLPDGQNINLSQERFRCPEALFQPNLLGSEEPGIHEMVYKSINKCPLDTRRSLYNAILVSGGNTLFPGFLGRLQQEVTTLAPSAAHPYVSGSTDRKLAVWTGGAILASLQTWRDMWVSKEEYEEHGDVIIEKQPW